jgi:hypothetical protein
LIVIVMTIASSQPLLFLPKDLHAKSRFPGSKYRNLT